MQTYDIIMLAILGFSVIIGAVKGMAWQIAMVASILISFFVAREFHPELAEALSGVDEPWNKFIAMASLYLLTSLGIWMLFAFCAKQIDKYEMKTFDRQTGALLGIVNGVILCAILTMCAIAFGGEDMHHRIAKSKSGPYVSRVLDIVEPIIPADLQDSLNEYLQQLHNLIEVDEQLEPSRDTNDSE
jgi:membrane protein required for colicin V production